MKKSFFLFTFLFLILNCSNIQKQHRSYRFDKKFLLIKYPFSVITKGKRFGVFVKKNKVKFIYPYKSISNKKIYLWAFLDNPQDHIKIKLKKVPGFTSIQEYCFSFKDTGSNYVAQLNLPNGIYLYFPTSREYNPCWWHSSLADQSFFIVGTQPKRLNELMNYNEIYWIKRKIDENVRHELKQFEKHP